MTTLTKDPNTGIFAANSGGGRSMIDLNGGSATTSAKDPYGIFNSNLASLLVSIRNAQSAGNTKLGGARDFLTTESVAPAGVMPFDPNIGSNAQVGAEQTLRAGFEPAVTSINTQMENTNRALGNLGNDIGTLETTYAPKTLGQGESLVTRTGEVLQRTPNYLPPQIRPDTGNLDSYDTANGVWKSDIMNGNTKGNTPVADNNNPLNIKMSNTTLKILEGLNPSTGSAATDGGNFLSFTNPTDGIKAARMVLQSSLYSNDTVDQALKAWSGGGYGSEILNGTGINPHAYIKELDGPQMDTLINQMRVAEGGVQNQGVTPSTLAPNVQKDAQDLAAGKVAPQILSDRYTAAYGKDGGTLYNLAVQAAKKINPNFNETEANLKYKGQQTQTENVNSGNPITNIFSNLRNAVTTTPGLNILKPTVPVTGKTSGGVGWKIIQ